MVHHPSASAQKLIHCIHLVVDICLIVRSSTTGHSLEEGLQNIETHIKIFALPLLDFGYGLPFLQTTIVRGNYPWRVFV